MIISLRFFGEKKVFKAKNVSFSINYNENVGLVRVVVANLQLQERFWD